MKYENAGAILLAGLFIAGAIVLTAPRYSLTLAPGGPFFRLDSRTGELTVCFSDMPPKPEHWTCHEGRPRAGD